MIAAALGTLSLAIWLYLLLARGRFWSVEAPTPAPVPAGEAAAGVQDTPLRVVAVIPARNEAGLIGAAVRSLLAQRGTDSLHLIVVDDASADGTAAAARAAAAGAHASERLTVLCGAPLPAGWSGKVWAMAQGTAAAAAFAPDYLLFTDADIHHDPENLTTLLARAQRERCDLVSYMVELPVVSAVEKLLIPAFVFFFFQIYPPRWVASATARTAAAAGGCMLLRAGMLERIGGLASIRSELIDDCALARVVKRAGGTLRLQAVCTARSTRGYGSFGSIGRMISRTAFYQLRHSWALLAATLAGLFMTYLLPPLLLLTGAPGPMALGAAAWLIMCACYAPLIRHCRLAPAWSAALPAAALFYAAACVHSAWQYARHRGGEWKGRIQDPPL